PIAVHPVIKSWNIEHARKTIFQHTAYLIHPTCYRASRIFPVANILQETRDLVSLRTTLRRHLITDTPHHDRWIITEMTDHIHHIPSGPVLEEPVVAVEALRDLPFIKRLDHHHQTQFITQLNQFRSRHVMCCADSVTAHILQ